jgi:hypothetical protein
VQLPEITSVAVVPVTVHTAGVVEAKPTANPELAVAASGIDVPAFCTAIAPKLIVWLAGWLSPPQPARRSAQTSPHQPPCRGVLPIFVDRSRAPNLLIATVRPLI